MRSASRSTSRSASNADKPVTKHLRAVERMPRPELVEHWTRAFGQPPSKGASTALLRRAVAYRIQEAQLGGLRKRALKTLLQFAAPFTPATGSNEQQRARAAMREPGPGSDNASSHGTSQETGRLTVLPASSQPTSATKSFGTHGSLPPTLRPGTRLVRSWQGKTHVVEVVEEGLVWNGKTYGSLSAVALAITGARWSGKRFFRL